MSDIYVVQEMNIEYIYKKVVLLSPYLEVLFRYIYWKNVEWLRKYRPVEHETLPASENEVNFDFRKLKKWLIGQGVSKGSLLVVHSSYDNIASCGLKPNEIVKEIREIIGDEGTLAMPVIRHYKELPPPDKWLKSDLSKVVCKYDSRRTPISSGMIPSMLMREKGAVVSMHPLNTMAALGPLAEAMMEHNMEGEKPTPHGENSSWKFCVDHDAVIVALGVQMIHHLTIAHVADEAYGTTPYEDWYDERPFDIVMPDKHVERRIVRDRKPKWGLLHDAEMNFGRDLERDGIMHLAMIDGVPVGILRAKELITYIKNRKHKAYPYYKIF